MRFRPIATTAASLLCLTAGALLAQVPGSITPEQGWSAIGQCASNSNERVRHACIDDVLRKAGLLTPQAEATERRRQFGLDESPARAAVPAPAPVPKSTPSPAPAAATKPPPAPVDAVERLDVQIARAAIANDGKLVVTTTDGAVWKQTDSDSFPRLPSGGEHVRIRKATLGSYLCELESHRTFRCLRQK
jgi:hypothetical protein